MSNTGRIGESGASESMLVVVWPASWLLFVPIVLVEAFVGARVLSLSYWRALKMVSLANLTSTLVGIPLTWLVLCMVRMLYPGNVIGEEASLRNVLVAAIASPWLDPAAFQSRWMIPTAALALCVPFFFVSVWMEGSVVRRFAPESVSDRAFRWSWRANLATYVPIGVGLLVAVCIAARRA